MKQFILSLILIIIMPLLAAGQQTDSSKYLYQKILRANFKKDSTSKYKRINLPPTLRYNTEDYILRFRDKNETFRIILLENVTSDFDKPELDKEGFRTTYHVGENMNSGNKFLVRISEKQDTTLWVVTSTKGWELIMMTKTIN